MARLILRYPNNVIKEVDFEQPRYRIGTAADNDLVIEGEGVGAHQAEIQIRDGAYTLTDVSEDKSTTVNGKNVEQVSITYGDRIAFGPIMGLFYPPQRRTKRGGGQPKMFMFMAAGGGAVVVAIVLILVLTTRSITTQVLQPTGVAFPVTREGEQPSGVEGRGVEPGAAERFEGEGVMQAQSATGESERPERFFLFRPFVREEVTLPEPGPEEIEARTAVAVPRGLRRLFFTKIPVPVSSGEVSAEQETVGYLETEPPPQEPDYLEELGAPASRPGRTAEGPGEVSSDFLLEEPYAGELPEEPEPQGLFSGFLAPIRRLFGGREQTTAEEGAVLDEGFATGGTITPQEGGIEALSSGTSEGAAPAEKTAAVTPAEVPAGKTFGKTIPFVETPVYSDEERRQFETGSPSVIPPLSSSETTNCEPFWIYPDTPRPEVPILRTGMTGRINDDGYLDVVFGTSIGELVALNGENGAEIFRRELGNSFLEPVISDVTGDGKEDLVVSFENGEVATYTNTLQPIWRYQGSERLTALPVLIDVNGDRIDDLVFGTLEMNVVALDGSTGFELWRFFDAESEIVTSPVSLHLNNDRISDVIFSTRRGVIYAIDGENGWGLWKRALTGRLSGPPAIADLDGDGEQDIVVLTRDGTLAAFGRDGRQLFSWQTEGSYAVPPTVGDVDKDGTNDIILMDTEGLVRVIEGRTRRELWSRLSPEGPVTGRIVLVDLEGDGTMEVVLPSLSGALLVLDGLNGEVRALFNSGGRIWTTPVVADLNSDRIMEILVGTEDGQLIALQVSGTKRGWLSFRKSAWIATNHDVQNTGHGESRLAFFPWN